MRGLVRNLRPGSLNSSPLVIFRDPPPLSRPTRKGGRSSLASWLVSANKADPKLLIVKHPIGGLNAEELAERIGVAANVLKQAVGA